MNRHKGATILVVDGEADLRRPLVESLSREGFGVIAAATGEEAIEILWRLRERIDWLFASLSLPGAVTGLRVAEEFRFAHPLRPVVHAFESPIEQPRPGFGNLYFSKPYRGGEVVSAFRRLIADAADPHPATFALFAYARRSSAEPKPNR